MDFDYDMDRYRIYPESEERVDKSFAGVYRVDGRRLIIFPDGSPEVIYGTISIELDEDGFLRERRIELEGFGPYGGVYRHWAQSIDA